MPIHIPDLQSEYMASPHVLLVAKVSLSEIVTIHTVSISHLFK